MQSQRPLRWWISWISWISWTEQGWPDGSTYSEPVQNDSPRSPMPISCHDGQFMSLLHCKWGQLHAKSSISVAAPFSRQVMVSDSFCSRHGLVRPCWHCPPLDMTGAGPGLLCDRGVCGGCIRCTAAVEADAEDSAVDTATPVPAAPVARRLVKFRRIGARLARTAAKERADLQPPVSADAPASEEAQKSCIVGIVGLLRRVYT